LLLALRTNFLSRIMQPVQFWVLAVVRGIRENLLKSFA
jgi:hypothetical protein